MALAALNGEEKKAIQKFYQCYFQTTNRLLFLGHEKIVQMLIKKGANVNSVNGDKNSALIFAADNGNIPNIMISK